MAASPVAAVSVGRPSWLVGVSVGATPAPPLGGGVAVPEASEAVERGDRGDLVSFVGDANDAEDEDLEEVAASAEVGEPRGTIFVVGLETTVDDVALLFIFCSS